MLKHFTSLLLLVGLFACKQELNCVDLRVGEYELEAKSVGKVLISRTKDLHIETIPSLDKQTEYSITWTGPCTFQIEYKSGDLPPGPNAKRPINCEIMAVADGTHTVRSQIQGTQVQFDYLMKSRKR